MSIPFISIFRIKILHNEHRSFHSNVTIIDKKNMKTKAIKYWYFIKMSGRAQFYLVKDNTSS